MLITSNGGRCGLKARESICHPMHSAGVINNCACYRLWSMGVCLIPKDNQMRLSEVPNADTALVRILADEWETLHWYHRRWPAWVFSSNVAHHLLIHQSLMTQSARIPGVVKTTVAGHPHHRRP